MSVACVSTIVTAMLVWRQSLPQLLATSQHHFESALHELQRLVRSKRSGLPRQAASRSTSGINFEHPNDFGEECVELCADWTVVHRQGDNSRADEYGCAYNCDDTVLDGFRFQVRSVPQIRTSPSDTCSTHQRPGNVQLNGTGNASLCPCAALQLLLGLGPSLLFMTRTTPRVAAAHNHGGLHF